MTASQAGEIEVDEPCDLGLGDRLGYARARRSRQQGRHLHGKQEGTAHDRRRQLRNEPGAARGERFEEPYRNRQPHCRTDQGQSDQCRISQQPAGSVEHGADVGDGQHQDRDRAERACGDRQRAGGEHAPDGQRRGQHQVEAAALVEGARGADQPLRGHPRERADEWDGQALAAGGPAFLHDTDHPPDDGPGQQVQECDEAETDSQHGQRG